MTVGLGGAPAVVTTTGSGNRRPSAASATIVSTVGAALKCVIR